ncbi:4a-hydroxytetrahydrobiopterin dehydratase [Gimesia sp.]|uniref:4a-hydroxytetrahydrobiopterin dehydratase n=1 Tax=Gimesia sp. TaxID=2024833 RepID=UPI003A903B3F
MTEDQALSEAELQEFLNTYSNWELRDGWIRRKYSTPGWSHTLMLVNTIGYLAEAGNHHPDLSVGYAAVTVKLQTHKVHAITGKDISLAKKIEETVLWQPEADSALEGFPKKWVH